MTLFHFAFISVADAVTAMTDMAMLPLWEEEESAAAATALHAAATSAAMALDIFTKWEGKVKARREAAAATAAAAATTTTATRGDTFPKKRYDYHKNTRMENERCA